MHIYIDINHMLGIDGKAVGYLPSVHWSLEDYDSVSPEKMNAMRNELEEVLKDNFKNL